MSKLIRRTHMYLALFLSPWLLMYAASTFVMNHRASFRPPGGGAPVFEKVLEKSYSGEIAAEAAPREIATQVLREVGTDGAHIVNASPDGERITILRQETVDPKRVVFSRADKRIVVEKQTFAMPAFLERMHRRRGFQHPYALEDVWAFSVDLVILAMVFWAISGVWMWWELKKTRRLGFAFGAAGFLLFALFLFTI